MVDHIVYEKLKFALPRAPVLAAREDEKQLSLYINASAVGLSAILARDGKAIAHAPRTLNSAERNYAYGKNKSLT